jgi:hypothetical protein
MYRERLLPRINYRACRVSALETLRAKVCSGLTGEGGHVHRLTPRD